VSFVSLMKPSPSARPARATLHVIEATDDGGATRHGLPAPVVAGGLAQRPMSDEAPGAVSEVRFGTHLDGWAFGPALWSTHDGGEY
jgi:hypothetical protein